MKILLVIPINKNKNIYEIASDLGFGYLATALRKNKHEVKVLDCINKKMDFDRFERYILNDESDIVGFKICATDLPSARKCIQIVKKHKPWVKILIGGIYPSSSSHESLNYFPEVDFGFKGEAEVGLPMLMEVLPNPTLKDLSSIPGLIYRNNGTVLNNQPVYLDDLDSLGIPAWDLIDPREYNYQKFLFTKHKIVAPVIATRGCPYHCKFCSGRSVTGNKVRAHSVSYLIDEVQFLIAEFGIKEVCFMDDNFAVRKDILREFCYKKIKQNLKFDWSCFTIRLDLLDKDTLKLMDESGCYWISVGIESGSQRILDDMNKRLNLEIVKEKLSLIRSKTNIKVTGDFIIGYPREEEIDIRKTIKFARDLPLFTAIFYGFHPIKGTPIYNELLTQEIIGFKKVGDDRKPYIPKNIEPQKLLALYRWAYISFYCRPRILFKILKSIRSPFQIKFLIVRAWERLIKK